MPTQAKYTARWLYSLLGLVAVLAAWYLLREKPVAVETAKIQRGTFEGQLEVDGTIRSRKKTTVIAFADGDLGRVDLKIGDVIKKNELITILSWDLKKQILSPVDGVVAKVYRESAGPILRGSPILDIIDPSDLEVTAKVLTSDAVAIPVGAPVDISGFDQNSTSLKGIVSQISRAGFTELSALGIEEEKTEIRVDFSSPPPRSLGDNFHVDLTIHLSRKENVILVPVSALFKNQDSWSVYKVENNRARLKNVEISERSNKVAVVKAGINEGDRVVLFPSDQISDRTLIKLAR